MASDYAIIEEELKKSLSQLKRDLYMKKVRTLEKKQERLAKLVRQRRLIKVLEDQIEELSPTVSLLYCPNNRLKDNETQGYLVYLLQLKENFDREVKTKQQMIREREEQIKRLVIKVTAMGNEYARKRKMQPRQQVEYMQLDNMSNRLNQMEKRICTVQHENKEIREKILDMRSFQQLYRAIERDLRAKIACRTVETLKHLECAVSTYEDGDALLEKSSLYKDRCSQDLKKAEVNQTALNIINKKVESFDELVDLQNQTRSDSRIAATADLIERGVTGLEPPLKHDQDLHSTVVKLSGRQAPEDIDQNFQLEEDQSGSVFAHLNDLMRNIHHTQEKVDDLKKENFKLLKKLSTEERKLRWEITENEKKVESLADEAEVAVESQDKARKKIDGVLRKLEFLHILCGSDPAKILKAAGSKPRPSIVEERRVTATSDKTTEGTEKILTEGNDAEAGKDVQVVTDSLEEMLLNDSSGERKLNDSNALEFLEGIEKNVLEYLMLVEYLRIKDLPVDDTPVKLSKADADEEIQILDKPNVDPLDTIIPRALESHENLQVEHFDLFPEIDSLKPDVVSMVAAMEDEARSKDITEELT